MTGDEVYRMPGEQKMPLETIKKQVAEEGKIGFELPKNLKKGDEVKELNNLAAIGSYVFDDIVFFSESTGILKFQQAKNINYGIGGALRWTDENKKFLLEVITYDNSFYVYHIGEYNEEAKK